MKIFSSVLLKESLAVVVISHGMFLTGFTYSFGDGMPSKKQDSIEEEGFSSFKDSVLNSFGCIVSAYTTEFVGPKRTIQLCFLSFLCAGILYLWQDSILVSSVSHAVSAVSLGTKPVFIIYVLEVSQKNRRGMFISVYVIFGSFGFACSYLLQYYVELRSLATASIIIAFAGFCETALLPETKYWYLMHNQIEKANDSSSRSHNSQTKDVTDQKTEKTCSNFQKSYLYRYRNFIVATALLLCRAGSGKVVFALYPSHYYSYFESFMRIPLPIAHNLAAFLLTVAFTAIVDHFKRRQLLFVSTVISISVLVTIMAINFYFVPGTVEHAILQPFLLLVYGAMIDGFLENLITVVTAEIISVYDRRGALLNVSYLLSFVSQTLYGICFPYVMTYLDVNCVLLFFMVNNVVMLALNAVCVPETSDMDFDEFGLFMTSI